MEKVPVQANFTFFLPACEFFTGVGNQVHHNWVRGHNNYFLGEVSHFRGWKLYFPVAVLLKWPTMVLLLTLAALALTLRGKIRWPREFLLLCLFPALFMFFAIGSNINIGERYVLPVYIFIVLGLAGVWTAAKTRAAKIALLAALALNAADGLRYAPDYLSHFNIFVRPAESWRLLTDSSLDWGQGLLALREYQAAHPGETLHLAFFGPVEPALYGIRYVPLGENERATGTVIVSATHLSGQLLKDPKAYHWLLQYPRKTILNHSLHVFEVPAATN
jgi:4-amino-4-deoxy-L-arabinose transferase-like glycosyltransferase